MFNHLLGSRRSPSIQSVLRAFTGASRKGIRGRVMGHGVNSTTVTRSTRQRVMALLALFAVLVSMVVMASPASSEIDPESVPSAPTGLEATRGDGSIEVSFTAGSDGGYAITNYEYRLDGGSWVALDPEVTGSPVTISGLTNGTEYSVSLRAVNSVSSGDASDSVSATPATTPSAPTDLNTTRGNGYVEVSFTDGFDGGDAITNYEYQLDGGSWVALDPASNMPWVTITGLTNGTEYSVSLRAVNLVGSGAASSS
ncbi:MAG: hypothetical protein F2837_09125, partial [Actinobacteria bacterium]|nr:hypothetical protein [Actinomycetota bacterium]